MPLPFFEAGIYFRDPAAFRRRLGRLTFAQGLVAACCGVLNIWGIVTYFVATHKVRAAVAFAIFLSTPLVSICLGALCFKLLISAGQGANEARPGFAIVSTEKKETHNVPRLGGTASNNLFVNNMNNGVPKRCKGNELCHKTYTAD